MSAHHSRKSKNSGAVPQDSKVSEAFFHKTKLCKFFPQGACVKGTSCPFAHVQSELVVPPDLYRTRMCMAFIKAGKCKDGEHCKYAHSRAELRTGTVPCNLEAACNLDDVVRSAAPTPYVVEHELSPQLPSPTHSSTPLLSMQDQQCFATGFASPTSAAGFASANNAAGFASPTAATPYVCLPFDGTQMIGNVDSLAMGASMSPSMSPMNSGLYYEDGAVVKHCLTQSSLASMSGLTTTEDDLGSFQMSSRRSSSDYGTPEGRHMYSSPENTNSETGSEEQQEEGDAVGDCPMPNKMVKIKEHNDRQEDSATCKFDVYLPQITEEMELDNDANADEYLDENTDSDFMYRQSSCPAGFYMSEDSDDNDEEAFLNNIRMQKFSRQVSAPAEIYKDTFLDLKVGNQPVFHQGSGYAVSIKNTFLDFGRPEEVDGARKRSPSL